MNIKEKLEEYKQRREAKKYFRSHNQYVIHRDQWPQLILVGIITSCIIGTLYAFIEYISPINFLQIIIGYAIAQILLRFHEGCKQLGIYAVVLTIFTFYIIGVVYAILLFQFPISYAIVNGVYSFVSMDLISWILLLATCYIAYFQAS